MFTKEELETLTPEEVKLAEEYMDNMPINISPADTKEKVYIEVSLQGATKTSKVIIRTKHDNFVYLESDGNVLLNEEKDLELAVTTDCEENILDTTNSGKKLIDGGFGQAVYDKIINKIKLTNNK